MSSDMARKGWQASDLARRAKPPVAVSTVTRFLSGTNQTNRMAKRLARALGHPIDRYMLEQEAVL